MQFLTAAEAISPALNRTASLLFRPFRWGTYLKLCAVAVLTEGMTGNLQNHGGPGGGHPAPGVSPHVMTSLPAGFIPMLIAVGMLALVLGVLLCYLIVRLRFALFECLVRQSRELRPGWRRYRDQAWRFFLFSIVVGVLFLALALAALAPFASHVIQLVHQSRIEGRIDFGMMLGLILQLLPVLLCLGLAGFLLDVVMRDFMLPHFALEDASAGDAWGAVWSRIAREKGAFVFYVVLRVLLPMVAMIGLFILLAIPMVIVFGGVAFFVAALHSSPLGSTPVAIFFEALAGLVALIFGLLIAVCFGGPVSIAIRNYALVFYGARYQVLGDALYPPMAPAAIAPQPAPGPA